jgi:hypothetical protein
MFLLVYHKGISHVIIWKEKYKVNFAVAHTGPFYSYFLIKYIFLFAVFLGSIAETRSTVA